MLCRRLRPGEVEDVRILLSNQSPFLGILEVCHKILPPLLGLMTANLTVPFPHGRAIQIVRSLQHGILTELIFDTQHGFLQGFLTLQLTGIIAEKAENLKIRIRCRILKCPGIF